MLIQGTYYMASVWQNSHALMQYLCQNIKNAVFKE
jgi:hypothetical protein